jgi:drug/metabolite transporter (DMT)-like permease
MPHAAPSVVAVVLAAAVLHASWNAIAHAVRDQLAVFTVIGAVDVVGGVTVAAVATGPARACWGFLAASAALHVAYILLLMRAYQLGHFGQVYPLARGTSPWLVAVVAGPLAGEALPLVEVVGVAVISAGLGTLVLSGGRPGRADLPAVAAAVGTGVMIAAYTTLDGLGVRRSGTVLGYTAWLFLLQGPVVPLITLAARRRRMAGQLRAHLLPGGIGGVLSLLAYGLVLWAQTRGALAPVAALRETSVIMGVVIGTVRFGEPLGRARLAAAVLVAGGALLITL